uniref:Uncharacterized protein n=1 Tax=Romanomermis culicivorax TaxID=13658 RepID=A0A915JKU8_ROMCU
MFKKDEQERRSTEYKLSPYANNGSDFSTKKTYNLEEVRSYIRIDDDYHLNFDKCNRESSDRQFDHNQETSSEKQTASSSSSASEITNDENEKNVERKTSGIDKSVAERNSSTVKRANSRRDSTSDPQEISCDKRLKRKCSGESKVDQSVDEDFRRRSESFGSRKKNVIFLTLTNRNSSFSYGEYVTIDNSIKTEPLSKSVVADRRDDHQCSKSLTDMGDSSPASLSSSCMAETFQRSCSLEQSIINDSTKKDVEKIIDTMPCANRTTILADVHVSSTSNDTSDDEILQRQQRSVRKTSESSSSPKTLSYTKLDETLQLHKNLNLNCFESQSLSKKSNYVNNCRKPPAFSFSNRSISASMLENLLVVDASNLRQIFLQQEKQKRKTGQTSSGANFTIKTVLAAN